MDSFKKSCLGCESLFESNDRGVFMYGGYCDACKSDGVPTMALDEVIEKHPQDFMPESIGDVPDEIRGDLRFHIKDVGRKMTDPNWWCVFIGKPLPDTHIGMICDPYRKWDELGKPVLMFFSTEYMSKEESGGEVEKVSKTKGDIYHFDEYEWEDGDWGAYYPTFDALADLIEFHTNLVGRFALMELKAAMRNSII